jgi:hypothetical protein
VSGLAPPRVFLIPNLNGPSSRNPLFWGWHPHLLPRMLAFFFTRDLPFRLGSGNRTLCLPLSTMTTRNAWGRHSVKRDGSRLAALQRKAPFQAHVDVGFQCLGGVGSHLQRKSVVRPSCPPALRRISPYMVSCAASSKTSQNQMRARRCLTARQNLKFFQRDSQNPVQSEGAIGF